MAINNGIDNMNFFGSNNDSLLIRALNTSQAFIEFSIDGKILSANENFLNAVGYTKQEIIGKHHRIFCDKAYTESEEYRTFWRTLASGQYVSGEFKRLDKNGKAVWLEASYNPVKSPNGKVLCISKIASQITDRKLQSLEESGKIEAINRAQAVVEFETDGTIIKANENFLKATGYQLSEIIGKHHRLFCDTSYTQSHDYMNFWRELANGNLNSGEFKRLGKGGREIYLQASYNPIFDETGKVLKVIKFATDITASVLKRNQNQTISQSINQDLGHVVGKMLAATEVSGQASKAASETGAMVSSVAAASEEMSASVRDITNSMSVAKNAVENTFRFAESAGVSASRLSQSASDMNNVVEMIQEIASQINLLALNATIESARAGEAGRGFAVVASEVKNLANQAASSTSRISQEIGAMQNITNEVVGTLGQITQNMTSVMENVTGIASAIEQQNAASAEISSNMQSAVNSIHLIEGNLGTLSQNFSEVADASEHVKHQVESLIA